MDESILVQSLVMKNVNRDLFEKVDSRNAELNLLTKVCLSEPRAAYCAFTHGLRHKYTYIMRAAPYIFTIIHNGGIGGGRTFVRSTNIYKYFCKTYVFYKLNIYMLF